MDNEHETMYPEIQGDQVEAKRRSRRGNYMGSLRLRGRTYWVRWQYKGESYERSTGIKIFEKKAEEKAFRKMEELTAPYRLANERDLSTFLSMQMRIISLLSIR